MWCAVSADAPDDARRELRGGAGLVQIVPPSGPGRHAEADRRGQGRRSAHPAPVPLLELPQQPHRLRVHRAIGRRRAALASTSALLRAICLLTAPPPVDEDRGRLSHWTL